MIRYQVVVIAIPYEEERDGEPADWDFQSMFDTIERPVVIERGPTDSHPDVAVRLWERDKEQEIKG